MAGWRQAVALAMTGEEIEALTALSRSRTEPAGRVSRAAMLLGYREKPSFFAVGRRLGVHHQTVQRCVERAMAYGALAALDDRPRPGKEPTITPEAKAWLVSLACDKAKEHGYPHELWTTRLLARHARERGPAAGHQCLARLAQGTVCKLLGQEEIKPHKVRYYLERRDAEFEPKMAEVLCVYREVQVLKKAAAKAEKSKKPVAIVSYDEKPGIHSHSLPLDHEYKRRANSAVGRDHLSPQVPLSGPPHFSLSSTFSSCAYPSESKHESSNASWPASRRQSPSRHPHCLYNLLADGRNGAFGSISEEHIPDGAGNRPVMCWKRYVDLKRAQWQCCRKAIRIKTVHRV